MCQRIGFPPTSTIGFGRNSVSSRSRVPRPPARMTAFIRSPSSVAFIRSMVPVPTRTGTGTRTATGRSRRPTDPSAAARGRRVVCSLPLDRRARSSRGRPTACALRSSSPASVKHRSRAAPREEAQVTGSRGCRAGRSRSARRARDRVGTSARSSARSRAVHRRRAASRRLRPAGARGCARGRSRRPRSRRRSPAPTSGPRPSSRSASTNWSRRAPTPSYFDAIDAGDVMAERAETLAEHAAPASEIQHPSGRPAFEPADDPLVDALGVVGLDLVVDGRERPLAGAEAHPLRAVAHDVDRALARVLHAVDVRDLVAVERRDRQLDDPALRLRGAGG